LQDISIEISASVVAWYGAIMATLAVLISGLAAWRDRSRILVSGMAGYRVTPGGPYDPTKEYILITVTNRGRRPRTIDKVGLKVRTGSHQHIMTSDSFLRGPQELTEGRAYSWVIERGEIALEDVEYVWAYDQTGKQFRGKLQRTDLI